MLTIDRETLATTPSHFSASQLNAFLGCSMLWYLQWVVKPIPKVTRHVMVFGSAVHEALAEYWMMRRDLASKDPGWDARAVLKFKEALPRLAAEAHLEFDDLAVLEGIDLVTEYCTNHAAKMTGAPIWVEQKFEIAIPGMSRAVVGYVDLRMSPGPIIDHKVTRSAPRTKMWPENEIQLGVYALAAENTECDPKKDVPARIDYLVRQGMGIVKIRSSEEILVTNRKRRNIEKRFQTMDAAIQAGSITPNTEYKFCSYCDYRAFCPAFAPEKWGA